MVQMLKNFVADGVDISGVIVELYDVPTSTLVGYPAPLMIEHHGDAAALRRAYLEEVATTRAADVVDRDRDAEGGWYWRDNGHPLGREWENELMNASREGRTAKDVLDKWKDELPRLASNPLRRIGGKRPPDRGYVN
jgi:hypothetical protein